MTCVSINKVIFYVNKQPLRWLIDTGASLSVIQLDWLRKFNIPFYSEEIEVKGIGGKIVLKGYVYLDLKI